MAVAPKLELRQSQTLVMTPQLQQAIKLLQLSNLELADFVEREVEQNPLLEIGEAEGSDAVANGVDADLDQGAPKQETGQLDITADTPASAAAEASLDADYDSVYTEDSAADRAVDTSAAAGPEGTSSPIDGRGGSSKFEDSDFSLENTLSEKATLKEHLYEQLNVAITNDVDRLIGAHLIDALDEAGYLSESLEDLAERLGAPLQRVENCLKTLQSFDPTGVFARGLGECLGLQLAERDRLDPAMALLLENLDLLAKQDVQALVRICGVDAEDILDMVGEIRALDPKPGLQFADDNVQTLVPDVYVRPDPDGGWRIELNSETLPKVLVNNQYYATVSRDTNSKEDRSYLSDCFNSANWLVKSLAQRANTILRVSTEIVRQQDGFFAHGVQHLRPLNLRAVADAIEMHESTVSRVTANKYMATNRGIFELKYFFTSAISASDGGEAHSAEAVRHRIKLLIDAELPDQVLSDDKIVDILRADDIDIARRTVAKYREALKIPSSVQRRRLKKMRIGIQNSL